MSDFGKGSWLTRPNWLFFYIPGWPEPQDSLETSERYYNRHLGIVDWTSLSKLDPPQSPWTTLPSIRSSKLQFISLWEPCKQPLVLKSCTSFNSYFIQLWLVMVWDLFARKKLSNPEHSMCYCAVSDTSFHWAKKNLLQMIKAFFFHSRLEKWEWTESQVGIGFKLMAS